MLIRELHDATRETVGNFFRTILESPLSAKIVLHCLRVLRGAATNYHIQTERRHLREFVISVKTMLIIAFLCYIQIYTTIGDACVSVCVCKI